MMWERDSDPLSSRFKTGSGYLAYEFVDEERQEQLLAELRQIIDRELANVEGECFVRLNFEIRSNSRKTLLPR
ncbi:hypothetical protein A4G28_26975 [Mycobacterium ostraviense]|uniref:Uncharacterized protein n=1 Tax=Mycobacterium ostraviense TaxID=2738409 RepID=A0A164EPP9_9MYCO|nr:hypothetical protein A4G28_26975 [Mycobacterium ostraviense]